MPVVNVTRSTCLATEVGKANNVFSRMVGLLGRKYMRPEEALWLVPCKGIHTFGMRFPIDALFLDPGGKVVYALPRLVPQSFSRISWKSHSVLELPAGAIEKSKTEIGDILNVSLEDAVPAAGSAGAYGTGRKRGSP